MFTPTESLILILGMGCIAAAINTVFDRKSPIQDEPGQLFNWLEAQSPEWLKKLARPAITRRQQNRIQSEAMAQINAISRRIDDATNSRNGLANRGIGG